jgi:hypothetical protein
MSPCSNAAVSEFADSVGHPVLEQNTYVHQPSSLHEAGDGDPGHEKRGLTLNLTETVHLLVGKPGRNLFLVGNAVTAQLPGGGK